MSEAPNIPNINQYHQHFEQTAPIIKHEPREDRSCNDKCCYVVFIILTLILVGAGLFFIISADFNDLATGKTTTTTSSQKMIDTYDIQNLKPGIPIIVGMIVFAILLAMIFLLLLVKFPKCVLYTMIFGGILLMLALVIMLFVFNQIIAAIVVLVVLLIFLCVFWCAREKLQVGVILLQTAANFIASKPSVYIAPFIVLILVLIFQIFWIVSLVAISLYTGDAKTKQQIDNQQAVDGFFILVWFFLQLFYSFFFHYCSVFLVATAAAMWYYNIDGSYILTGLKRIFSNHLGSITFAAMLIAIVSSARQSAENRSRQNQGAAAICYCLVACLFKIIEDLLQVLNNNAIIVMAVTGEDYIDSAKSTISIIFNNFFLFYIIDMVSGLIRFAGIIFICAIPGIVGFLLLQATAQNPQDTTYLAFGTIIIVLISMLIGAIFLSVLSEALSCIFVFYCLDRKLLQLGYPTPKNVPPTMRSLFDEMNRSSGNPVSHNVLPNPAGIPQYQEPTNRNTYNPNYPNQNNYPQNNFNQNNIPNNYNQNPYPNPNNINQSQYNPNQRASGYQRY